MSELRDKKKRVNPLIRARKSDLDQEVVALEKVKGEKRRVFSQLKEFEKKYLSTIQALNTERQSTSRDQLELLEQAADRYKDSWYETLRLFREMESRERAQLAQTLMAKRQLQSMEKLQERYQIQINEDDKQKEQKQLDETNVRKFSADQHRR